MIHYEKNGNKERVFDHLRHRFLCGNPYVSVSQMARDLELSPSTIRRWLRELEKERLVLRSDYHRGYWMLSECGLSKVKDLDW